MMDRKKIYIAGPMRGHRLYNFPAFYEAEEQLQDAGWITINPARMDRMSGFDPTQLPDDHDWNSIPEFGFDFQKAVDRDLQAIKECDAVYMLRGWQNSKGAYAEHAFAGWLGKEILYEDHDAFVCGQASKQDEQDKQNESDSKPTNPKDAIATNKLPVHLWPSTATAYGCIGMLDGMLKYGRSNFRAVGVRASVYVDACKRHLNAWFEGEDYAPDSGVHHLGHALACLAILVDAMSAGKLEDDRNYPGGYLDVLEELEETVSQLREMRKERNPKHYTIQDEGQFEQ